MKYKEAKERLDRGDVADADKDKLNETVRARPATDAVKMRKDLLERLADAQRKQADAKAKRDGKPGDSNAQSDYDRATEDMRSVEKALEQLNAKYGKDIERYAEKLINQYKAEKESHERPLSEAKNRVDNCKKVDNMSY